MLFTFMNESSRFVHINVKTQNSVVEFYFQYVLLNFTLNCEHFHYWPHVCVTDFLFLTLTLFSFCCLHAIEHSHYFVMIFF